MMNKIALANLIGIMLLVAAGCQKGTTVQGKVAFSDGKPLSKGQVCFQDERILARGDIAADGRFRLRTNAGKDGVPEGHYKVYITDAVDKQIFPPAEGDEPIRYPIETSLIDVKFTDPATSGITCTVAKGMKPFDITVEPPAEKAK